MYEFNTEMADPSFSLPFIQAGPSYACEALTIEEALICLLTEIGITAYLYYRPQKTITPIVTWELDEDDPQHVLGGSAGYSQATFQITVYANNPDDAITITDMIRLGIDSRIGQMLGSIMVQAVLIKSRRSRTVPYGSGGDQYIFSWVSEYFVKYLLI